jgi:hypothetical protein
MMTTTFPSAPLVTLPLPDSEEWLVSFYAASNAYTIFLTDQNHVYRESLNEQEIIDRAEVNMPLS